MRRASAAGSGVASRTDLSGDRSVTTRYSQTRCHGPAILSINFPAVPLLANSGSYLSRSPGLCHIRLLVRLQGRVRDRGALSLRLRAQVLSRTGRGAEGRHHRTVVRRQLRRCRVRPGAKGGASQPLRRRNLRNRASPEAQSAKADFVPFQRRVSNPSYMPARRICRPVVYAGPSYMPDPIVYANPVVYAHPIVYAEPHRVAASVQ